MSRLQETPEPLLPKPGLLSAPSPDGQIRRGHESLHVKLAYLKGKDPESRKKPRNMRSSLALLFA
ncbi:MAG: hypothetical protein DMG72_02265 [Acidobacteria bacterium]|nr:MAG: hypothetical protein DMG72_02265 [Acidobacteriota bacterium]